MIINKLVLFNFTTNNRPVIRQIIGSQFALNGVYMFGREIAGNHLSKDDTKSFLFMW
jgi:hypothetical protein